MLRIFLLFGLSITLASCSSAGREHVSAEESIQKTDSKTESDKLSFSNPALISGTSVGELIQQFYKQGKWTELIKFISTISIDDFGKENIISSFQRTDFGYSLKLKSMNIIGNGRYLLNYETLKFGTIGVLRMGVVLESDTAKIIIKQIYPIIQFDDLYDGTQIPYFGC